MGSQEDLRAAVCCGSTEAVQTALAAGARADIGSNGWWPVHTASSMGHLGVLQLLLEKRADLHQPSTRLRASPLHLAAKEGHAAVVDLLLEQRAEIDARDLHRRSPVSWACQKGHLEVVQLLLTLRCDVTLADEANATPFDWAVQGLSYLGDKYPNYEKILAFLQKHKAQVQGKSVGPLERCPYPSFMVNYIENRRGRWQRHSKAITREEIMGEKERIDMKVCWKYTPAMGESGPMARHVAQVGTLSLLDPNSMSDCLVSLTSLVKKQTTPYAPMIISFRTATAETGKRYTSLEGRMRLRIYFVRTVALKATFVDGAAIEENQGEDELNEARQYICGKLFREVWSSDELNGFPMPRGCYYKTYGQTQELNILFDRKNGLAPGKYYQVVLSGVAMDEESVRVPPPTSQDVDVHPYLALERGIAPLYRSPQDAAYGSQGVKFAETEGVKISSGDGTEMLELKGGTELKLVLKGDPLGGGISASAILRIFLWPLTQWNVANACTVSCIAHDQVSAPCGAVQDCKGDAIIPNFHQNYLRIVLPSAMATITEFVSHTLVFPDLVLPQGGFFSTRLAAQISKADDTKPHYTESSGDYLYKMPDEGVGVGKLVEFYGDGDQRPFRGDLLNILYANLVLPATLFAAVQTADASLTLTLPEGYECVRTADINGESPWRAEDTLGVFQDEIPQGTGSLDEGGGTRGWSVNGNVCLFTLRQNAVVYAGSSLYIRVTANNPTTALKRTDAANRWQVTLTSKGYHQYYVTFPPVIFNTIMQNFSSNT
ncbi:unnamed protein product, partial [Cladocopium goreaui]